MPTVLEPIQVLAGVEPITDRPEATTQHYTNAKHIRFIDGLPEKIGGWEQLTFDDDEVINGSARSIFSYKLDGLARYLVGTNTRLYDVFGTVLTNITPLDASLDAIPNSLDTYHATLGNNPIATTIGSDTIIVTDTAHKFIAGDDVTLSGSTAVNGVPAVEINAKQFIRSVTTNTYSIIIPTPATSTGSGGGAAVVRASGYVTVAATAHDLSDGDRVGITGAVAFGGILAVEINVEFLIRNVVTNAYDVYTVGTSTSSVSSAGGAGTNYQKPIPSGSADTLLGQGYGVGLYGVGLYGVSKTSLSTTPPRIWSHDRFGGLTLSCAGNGTGIYQWDGSRLVAPVLVANAPTEVNYVFVSDSITIALGYDDLAAAQADNGITWSGQGELTNWTTGQSGTDVIEGAGRFISHASARQQNLLFTESQTYTFRYIGGQLIWETKLLDNGIGLIAQNARVSASGVVFWMSGSNFYMWRGGGVEIIPSNSSTESTILRYVFEDINFGQKEKIFCWYNSEFREVWWHYPSEASNEPDRIARLNIDTFAWTIDELDRTAAEYPSVISQTPYLSDTSSVIQLHENGLNANGAGMEWEFSTNKIYGGTDTIQISAFVPDQNMTGSFNVNLTTRDYPSSPNKSDVDYTITATTDRVAAELNGRYWQFTLSGNELDQQLEIGQWYHEVERSTPK